MNKDMIDRFLQDNTKVAGFYFQLENGKMEYWLECATEEDIYILNEEEKEYVDSQVEDDSWWISWSPISDNNKFSLKQRGITL